MTSLKRIAAITAFLVITGASFLIGIATGYSLSREDNHDALLQSNREIMRYRERFGVLDQPALAQEITQ